MTEVRILAAGVDTLYISARGTLRAELLARLDELQTEAKEHGTPALFTLPDGCQSFLLRPTGRRRHEFCLCSPSFDVMLRAPAPHPDAYIELRSGFIHSLGAEDAVAHVDDMLRRHVFAVPPTLAASRIDVYADTQGWTPAVEDTPRFVTRARRRRSFEEVHTSGRALTGLMFGRGDIVVRIYDKTLQMRSSGHSWQELVWQDADPSRNVWRVEVQFRRAALRTFRNPGSGVPAIDTPDQALDHRQELWEYGTTWLSLRDPDPTDGNVARWPVADAWSAIRSAAVGSPRSELVRARIRGDNELKLVQGFVGYATALEAQGSAFGLDKVVLHQVPAAGRYLHRRGTAFGAVVEEKRRMNLRLVERQWWSKP